MDAGRGQAGILVAAQVGFELAEMSGIEVRLENEQPVEDWLVLLRR